MCYDKNAGERTHIALPLCLIGGKLWLKRNMFTPLMKPMT